MLNIGSFRPQVDVKNYLSKDLYSAIFDDVPDGLNVNELITIHDSNAVYLNHAAFGRAYNLVANLNIQLRSFAERNPDLFYDQLCLPLIQHSYSELEKFFASENVLIVPNCTFGIKCITDKLIQENHKNIAVLSPLYGATENLLQSYLKDSKIKNLVNVKAGEGYVFEESAYCILDALEQSLKTERYTVLFCDETCSQSGRILPMEDIARFCNKNSIVLVVDGTQSCELLLERPHVTDLFDYFVLSTHKWLGNSKTCGIIKFKEKDLAPSPCVPSFGLLRNNLSIEQIKSNFMWQGMLDSYISYITLSKALKIFSKYGKLQLIHAHSTLQIGVENLLAVVPLLPEKKKRVINSIMLENAQFGQVGDSIPEVQKQLQDLGIYVSVKQLKTGCLRGFSKGKAHGVEQNGHNGNHNGINGNTNGQLNGETNGDACTLKAKEFYIRLSCWSYNKTNDFYNTNLILNSKFHLGMTTTAGFCQHFLFVFNTYEKLFSVLKTKAFFIRAERLRHHLIFYYAHTAVFYINKLLVSGFIQASERIDPKLESTMAVGVDEMSWDDCFEDNYEWSNFSDVQFEQYLLKVKAYRRKMRDFILKQLEKHPINGPIERGSFHWVISMGIDHEKIHNETSAVIISQVPLHLLKNKHSFNFRHFYEGLEELPLESCVDNVPRNQFVHVPAGSIAMGKDHVESQLYGWDNEFGSEKKDLLEFKASKMLVSNAEYLEFVNDGAYEKSGKKWWSPEGWQYVVEMNVKMPRFWINKSRYRTLLKEIPMPWNFPVVVNNLEAEAFCNWKSEQINATLRLISKEEAFYMQKIATQLQANICLNKYGSSTPVNYCSGLIDGHKVYDIIGNVWRHSVSVLTVMNGFKIDPNYDDFTLPTIDGKHNAICGGSWISMGSATNLNARYGFRRHFYQYAGIRYVQSENTYHKSVVKMFEDVSIGKHITEHYKDFEAETLVAQKPVKNWPFILGVKASEVINQFKGLAKSKVLIVHGSTGRSTLEILRSCKNLIVDNTECSANGLQVLDTLLQEGRIRWCQQLEGELVEMKEYLLNIDESCDRLLVEKGNEISYSQADYKNLRSSLNSYDFVVADFRYKDCNDVLEVIANRLKTNGVLILGRIEGGGNFLEKHSLPALQSYFSPVRSFQVKGYPHMYSQTRSKHQYAISQLSVWQKVNLSVSSETHSTHKVAGSDIETTAQYYEDKDILKSYHLFHFGEGLLSVKNFPLQMSEIAIEVARKYGSKFNSALEAGCGPGRSAIELCKFYERVEAYDYSQGFIDMVLKEKDNLRVDNLIAYQGDSHSQEHITREKTYDLIIGCNLIDRLHTPKRWLEQSKQMLAEGGLLVVSSPYTWMKEHTQVENWIGGFKKDGENYFTLDGLKDVLLPELELIEMRKVPFVIPDSDGSFQYTCSNCTIFGKVKAL